MIKKIFLLVVLINILNIATAQISEGGKPFSFTNNLEQLKDVESLDIVSESWKTKAAENSLNNGALELVAKNIETNFSINNSGQWQVLSNGNRVWRIKITAQKAKGVNLLFKDFYLPVGAKLFVYNETKSQVIGAFTNFNNVNSKLFSTEIIFGNTLIVEYFEPKSQVNKGSFTIEAVGSFFKNVNNYKGTNAFGDSQPCQVNINCSPEGDNYQDEKKGVARILVTAQQGQGWCTGSLVNNTNLDCKPYFLTAYHCGNSTSPNQFDQWVFYFHYEFNGCSNSSEPNSNTMTGASVKARANDLGANTTSSDFLLLELNQLVPQNYDVYYNGWKKDNVAPPSGVAIHHPAGDVKKISTYSSPPSTVGISWQGTGYTIISGQTHWSISWSATQNGHGVSEGGSSGSPIFNNTGYVVGTLTGGGSGCNSTSSQDQYGKMSFHWASNSTSQTRQLKPWLDPLNTGQASLEGTFSPCTAATTNDAAITEIISPKGDLCNENYTPRVRLKNNGAVLLTSATITYQVNSNTPVVFNWTGSLTSGATEVIVFTAASSTLANNTFTATVSNPNGIADENNTNNSMNSNFKTNVQKPVPFKEEFGSTDFPNTNWFIANIDNDRTWEKATGVGAFGNSSTCMYLDNWDYEANGQYDWFVSSAYDFSDSLIDVLYFEYAYTYYKQTNGSLESYDTLGIAFSPDCGVNFYWLWKEGGKDLATYSSGLGVEFIPQNNEWESKEIKLNDDIIGKPSIMFAFIAINGYGNNLYIDNIGIGKNYLPIEDEISNFTSVKLFPNPASNSLNLQISLKHKEAVSYTIFNTIGQVVFSKNMISTDKVNEVIDINNFEKGMYYIKLNTSEGQKILKFIKD